MFKCVVHDRNDLTRVQKLTYLRGQLTGDAQKIVDGFNIEGASYDPAVALLERTFGHPDRIKTAHITAFLNIPFPQNCVDEIKSCYANVENRIRSIVGQIISLEEFCVVTLVHKLPSQLREIIKREMSDSMLDYKVLSKCLQREIFNMAEPTLPKSVPQATATFTAQSLQAKYACKLCSGNNHCWYKCFKY